MCFETKELYDYKIHSICLMTNHFHMLIETQTDELWKIMQRMLHPYSMDFNNKYKFTGHVFENRYTACIIEDESYFLEASRYIHLNPVKAMMVRKIQQERFKGDNGINCNAQMTTAMIQKYCKLDEESTEPLKKMSEKYGYSARGIHKLLRLARTSADLDGVNDIRLDDIKRILKCRDLDVSSSKMYTIS